MRRVLPGDIVALACALLDVPGGARARYCKATFEHAHAAHKYFKRFGRAHGRWGNGSLQSVFSRERLGAEPGYGNVEYCRATAMALLELDAWRRRALSL